MDRNKTGELIAAARKGKNMTQKELAAALHVSDRAVSKWERGAGFPDVGLLEPLAAALELNVLDLLRGERTEETDIHAAVQETMRTIREKQKQDRRQMRKDICYIVLVLLPLVMLWLCVKPITREVDQTITAGVYVDGVLAAYTDVEMRGEVVYLLRGKREYFGRFAIECVEWTCREGAKVNIAIDKKDDERGVGSYLLDGTLAGDLVDFYSMFSPDMTAFAMALQSPNHLVSGQPRAEEWCILATSPEMYEAYCTQIKNQPPLLQAGKTAELPEFPSAWART